MNKLFSKLIPFLFIGSLCACSSYLDMSTTTFYQDDMPLNGSIHVKANDSDINSSLEFSHYKTQIEIKLAEKGYTIASESGASMIALVSYGIEYAQASVSTNKQPNMTTSVGIGRSSRGRHASVGISSANTMNSATVLSTDYSRYIHIKLLPNSTENATSLYEGKVRSKGRCADINAVFPKMLFALFVQFPGISGQTQEIEIEGKEHC